jgi:two-component system, OmpR family, response regulator ArlR
VEQSYDGADALTRLSSGQFDLIILDLILPSVNGLEICRRYRENGGTA